MTESNPSAMQFELGDDGILLATLDLPGRAMNVLNAITTEAIEAMVARMETDPAVKGLVLRSGKKDHLAGADLEGIKLITTAEQAFELSMAMKRKLPGAGAVRQAHGGGDPRHVLRRRAGSEAGLPPALRGGRRPRPAGHARGQALSARSTRCRWWR